MIAVGERIGAVMSVSDGTAKFLGYGVYKGNEIPPDNIGGFNLGNPVPKLELDNGKVVYGCECWWGKEERIKEALANCKDVIDVDIDEERINAEARQCNKQ